MGQYIFPPSDEKLHELYVTEGKTQREIASIYNVSAPTVKTWIALAESRLGLGRWERHKRSRSKTPPDDEELLKINNKTEIEKLAEEHSVSSSTVRRWIADAKMRLQNKD